MISSSGIATVVSPCACITTYPKGEEPASYLKPGDVKCMGVNLYGAWGAYISENEGQMTKHWLGKESQCTVEATPTPDASCGCCGSEATKVELVGSDRESGWGRELIPSVPSRHSGINNSSYI